MIILTVPHEDCNSPDHYMAHHQCDFTAKRIAISVSAALGKKGLQSAVKVGRVNTSLLCKDSRYAPDFVHSISSDLKAGNIVLVLDIHSYSPGEDNWRDYNVVILYDSERSVGSVEKLHSMLVEGDIGSMPAVGIHNDIQERAHSLGAESFILNVNEGNGIRTDERIAGIIAQWCYESFKSKGVKGGTKKKHHAKKKSEKSKKTRRCRFCTVI